MIESKNNLDKVEITKEELLEEIKTQKVKWRRGKWLSHLGEVSGVVVTAYSYSQFLQLVNHFSDSGGMDLRNFVCVVSLYAGGSKVIKMSNRLRRLNDQRLDVTTQNALSLLHELVRNR
jgi:hypothetical protein